jgi:hypothetical protein
MGHKNILCGGFGKIEGRWKESVIRYREEERSE